MILSRGGVYEKLFADGAIDFDHLESVLEYAQPIEGHGAGNIFGIQQVLSRAGTRSVSRLWMVELLEGPNVWIYRIAESLDLWR